MTYTPNNDLETQASGQADWDTGLNANFNVLDRGFHGTFVAGTAISTGQVLWPASGGALFPYNSRSLSLRAPLAFAYKAVSSGESDTFLLRGIVTSLSAITSGNIIPGQPFYVAPLSVGLPVSSYAAAAFPAGIALRNDAVYFAPGCFREVPEKITQVQTLGPYAIGSTHHFTCNIGNRGLIRKLEGVTSFNNWTLKFYSGSTKVSSELLFETLSGGVTSTYMLDGAGFPYENTDTASPGLIFGSVLVSSGVSSGYFNVTVTAERFR